jgi:transketolase
VIVEHTTVGGLGSAVLEHINAAGIGCPPIFLHGIADRFVETGDYAFMLKMNRLDAEGIAAVVRERLGLTGSQHER